ncbi:hypothetical protein BJX99DRAFT_239844 [Aspergillus californicus]
MLLSSRLNTKLSLGYSSFITFPALIESPGTMSLQSPFQKANQLNSDLDTGHDYLPGYPRIQLSDQECLYNFIYQELWANDLETIANRLWWMSKQDSGNISPLHRQAVKNRKIIITEDPKLHLVWIDNRIFLKPLPAYLTSYSFWHEYMNDESKHISITKLRKAALGYLRTYSYLIQYESDLRIAQDPALGLVPKELTWAQFCHFSANLKDIPDNDVSGRYQYGEIRLTRLNYYAPVLLGRTWYHRVDHQYRMYFARIQGPLLSAFAFFAILLNCMQVYLAAATSQQKYMAINMVRGCYWVSILIGAITCFLMLLLVFVFGFKIFKEWRFATSEWLRRRKEQRRRILEEQSL